KFSVMMQIVDSTSTNGPWDDFRWSVYDANATRLFSLAFDNASLLVLYALDDPAGFISTDVKFDTRGYYELSVAMDFARNVWTATLNDEVIVNSKPITTLSKPPSLGDIDAVWGIRDPKNPGDNYMLFDNYSVTSEAGTSIPPQLEFVNLTPGGLYRAQLIGTPGVLYEIQASSDFETWERLLTVTAPTGGTIIFQDSTAPLHSQRFYRARQGS